MRSTDLLAGVTVATASSSSFPSFLFLYFLLFLSRTFVSSSFFFSFFFSFLLFSSFLPSSFLCILIHCQTPKKCPFSANFSKTSRMLDFPSSPIFPGESFCISVTGTQREVLGIAELSGLCLSMCVCVCCLLVLNLVSSTLPKSTLPTNYGLNAVLGPIVVGPDRGLLLVTSFFFFLYKLTRDVGSLGVR